MHIRILVPSFLIVVPAAFALHAFAQDPVPAVDGPARCYSFRTTEVPEREAHPSARVERWCYQTLKNNGGTYIYNADKEKVRPELALVRAANGVLTHGSLQSGHVTMHSVRAGKFNPFPVPLEEPRHMAQVDSVSAALAASAGEVLGQLTAAANPNPPESLTASVGTFTATADALPWRGYWWPMKGQPMIGPMSKYDSYSASRGSNPGAASWESSHHVSHNIWWEGHCNGWAAAAVLRNEPRESYTDSNSGTSFRVSDQKGILTEEDYCANAAFFGHRYRGPGDVLVSPAEFYHAFTYYLGSLHKLVAMNEDSNGVVDNRVISSYTMTTAQSAPSQLTVTMVLRVHNYDGSRVEAPGVAPSYMRTYRFTLEQDAEGNVSGGQWLSAMPGFVWVPLSPGKCADGNPRMSEGMIGGMMR
jgi:hypothetical protein